jgi:asparagine N-glycosylation enzyme membrane subunit Stt3
MVLLRLMLPILACVLLAAHFFRADQLALALASALLPLLLAVPRAWAARTMQVALVIGAIEWLRTLAEFAAVRISMGQPVLRLVAILVAVALFTAASALVFRSAGMRARYRLS